MFSYWFSYQYFLCIYTYKVVSNQFFSNHKNFQLSLFRPFLCMFLWFYHRVTGFFKKKISVEWCLWRHGDTRLPEFQLVIISCRTFSKEWNVFRIPQIFQTGISPFSNASTLGVCRVAWVKHHGILLCPWLVKNYID